MKRQAQPRFKNYVEIGPEAHQIKLRLLDQLGVSANALAEMAIRALAADLERKAAQCAE